MTSDHRATASPRSRVRGFDVKRPVLPAPFPEEPEPVDIGDPARLATWIFLVKYHAIEAIAAGEDALRPLHRRRFRRPDAAFRIALGKRNLLRLIAAAQLAIPAGALPHEDPDRDPPSTARRRPARRPDSRKAAWATGTSKGGAAAR